MSHYTVMVLFESKELEITRLLAPYDENLEVRHVVTRDELIRRERESFENYCNRYYAEYLKAPEEYLASHDKAHGKYISEEFPKRLAWGDDEFYKEALRGFDEEDVQDDGSVIETYNPNAKWDWWDIGGRWADRYFPGDIARLGDVIDSLPSDFCTYAVVTPDGEWHAPGMMGWFGCSSETDEEFEEWRSHFRERFLDTANLDWNIAIVDCHI